MIQKNPQVMATGMVTMAGLPHIQVKNCHEKPIFHQASLGLDTTGWKYTPQVLGVIWTIPQGGAPQL